MTFQELMNCYVISDDENNEIVYEQFLKMFKMQNITPIIGAGMSSWAYPLWGELLRKLATGYGLEKEIEHLLENNLYEDAATLLESEITHNKLIQLLQHEFRTSLMEEHSGTCPEYLRNIPKLFTGPIVTTNFDRTIEYLFFQQNITGFDTITPFDKKPAIKVLGALAKKKSLLIKMHGDLEDPEHLVLTKEAYDRTYGTDFHRPDFKLNMPNALKTILNHNPALFLGCSLSVDRTCSIIRSCAIEHELFAFLELPKETYNKENPYKPILHGSDGKFVEAFRNRRKYIVGQLNIHAIWYPYGMHKDAYSILFSKLSEALGILSPNGFVADVNYAPLHSLFGRKTLVDNIVRKFVEQSSPCVWVDGSAGVGKTEVCKAVYAILKNEYSVIAMPFIDVTGISSLSAFFDVIAEKTHISIPSPIEADSVSQYLLNKLIEKYFSHLHQNISLIMYFDNWEDIWYALTSKEEKESLIKWMRMLMSNNIKILVSSRVCPPTAFSRFRCHLEPLDNNTRDIATLSQEEFDKLDSVKLFCNILEREIAAKEKDVFRTLIKQLEGHPLAIVLTATQAQREISLNDLLDRWDKAKQDTIGIRDVHENLAIALSVSWNAITANHEAVIQWGLHYYSLKAIPADIFQELRGDSTDEAWNEGFHILADANLVYVTSDREAIAMLLPLKKQFARLILPNKNIQETCLIRWATYAEKLLDKEGKQFSPHHHLVEFAPQIFYIMEQLMTFETDLSHQYLNRIVKKIRYYYQFYVQSETLLDKLISFYKKNDSAGLLPIVLEDYGNLLRRLGRLDRAKEAYDNAEPLYRRKGNNRGLANLLKSRGDLLRRQGYLNEAKEVYDEAEKYYRQEGDNLGLANLLKSRGDLLRRLQNFASAKETYNEAKLLYFNENEKIGLAYLLKSQGDLLCQMEISDEAKKAYDEAEKYYRQEGDNLGLADLLKSQGNLLRQQNNLYKALEAYDAAEQLYRLYLKDEECLELKNLLKSRENLQHRLNIK